MTEVMARPGYSGCLSIDRLRLVTNPLDPEAGLPSAAKESAEKVAEPQKAPSAAKARIRCGTFMYELKLVPFKAKTLSSGSKACTLQSEDFFSSAMGFCVQRWVRAGEFEEAIEDKRGQCAS
jgi:hypothetical protein